LGLLAACSAGGIDQNGSADWESSEVLNDELGEVNDELGEVGQAASPSSFHARIANHHSESCLHSDYWMDEHANIEQVRCDTSMQNQKFWLIRCDGYRFEDCFQIYLPWENECMDVEHGSKDNGANVRLWDCNGTGAQQFRLEGGNDGRGDRIRNLGSNKCLDIQDWSTLPGGNLQQWDCNLSAANQRFWVLPFE
jgi:hypothetical protein